MPFKSHSLSLDSDDESVNVNARMLKVVGASWTQTRASWIMLAAVILLGTFTIFFVESPREGKDGNYAATVSWIEDSQSFYIDFWGQGNDPKEVKKGIARAYYRPDMSVTGWAVMEIETQPDYPDWVQAYAAGSLEGSLSWQLIYWHWQNTIEKTCEDREEFCENVRLLLSENSLNIRNKSRVLSAVDPYWHQVNLFYHQLDGLIHGWRYAVKRSLQDYEIDESDFLWMNVASDIKDLELKFNATVDVDPKRPSLAMALLKIVPEDPSQFLLAHASSALYSAMLRVQKRYRFSFHNTAERNSPLVPGQVLAFTSYPGSIHSQDDFYQISGSTNLTITGTVIKNVNNSLWDETKITKEVLMGPRVLAANRLSQNGYEWFNYMNKSNSGTGNKQWMVIQPSNKTVSLWVVEQLPGITYGEDQTDELKNAGYWASFGNPYYQVILTRSGNQNSSQSQNDAITNPVAKVLEQGQVNVTDIDSLVSLMRSPDLALVGRSDLSLEDISNYTHFWEVKYNQSRNLRSANSMTDDTQNALEEIKKEPETPYPHYQSFREIFHVIVQLKKLNNIKINSLNSMQNSGRLHHTSHGIPRSIETTIDDDKKKVLSLREFSGVIDLKVCGRDEFRAAAGPPFSISHGSVIVKPFQWSKSPIKDLPHIGQSDVWEYSPVKTEWVWL
uniref:Phospholipase B-like n=2 Tax=Clastoptera arizonana TaxID=38151 RepID=A0A1B6DDF0_9HEMI